jgi:hypothetical protein
LGGAFKTDFVVLSLVYIAEATIIATLSPSIAALTMPPA